MESGIITGDTLFAMEGDAKWEPLKAILNALEPPPAPVVAPARGKSRVVYAILAILFGFFGIHDLYAGHNRFAVVKILITVFGAFVLVGPFISEMWAILDVCTTTRSADGRPMD